MVCIVSCSACLNTVHNKKTLNFLYGETSAETLLPFFTAHACIQLKLQYQNTTSLHNLNGKLSK